MVRYTDQESSSQLFIAVQGNKEDIERLGLESKDCLKETLKVKNKAYNNENEITGLKKAAEKQCSS